MKGGYKLWSTVVDYFLILGAIIGVGFASGKEIYVFFFGFGEASLVGLIAFGLLYIYLFFVIDHISQKLKLKTYDEFNGAIFGRMCKITKAVLLVNFIITSAGMLAGADYLFQTFSGVGFKIPSIVLTVLCFLILLGGIDKIKSIANIIIPLMLSVIIINSLKNITPQNVHVSITTQNGLMAVYYGLLFGVNNFVAAMPILFETKLKKRGKLVVIISICLVILLNILVFAGNTFATEMPMFEVSKNVSSWFYYVYFLTLNMALFSTLMICSYNTSAIISNGKKSAFVPLIVVMVNLLISNVGYEFIVQYLYVLSGIISGIYVVVLIVLIVIKLLKLKKLNDIKIRIFIYKIDKNLKIANKKMYF